MRVALVCPPLRSAPCNKFAWVGDAFTATGHDVRYVHSLADVAAADAECDLLLFWHKSAGLNHNDIARLGVKRRAKWAQWYFDLIAVDARLPLAEQFMVKQFAPMMRAMDVLLVKERDLLADYQHLGINAVWFDQACPSNMPACTHAEKPEWDVLVLGTTDRERRRQDARALADAGLRVLWAGLPGRDSVPPGVEGHPWVHPLELPKLISRCGFVLGVDYRTDLRGYTSDRTWLAMGAGAVYAVRGGQDGRDRWSVPADDAPCVNYWDEENPAKAAAILGLDQRDNREQFGRAAREYTMANHTYEHRARQLIEMLFG